MAETYNAKSLRVLEGLDAVRLRPGMYIGTTGPRGLHHLLWEIVDNAIDEASSGFATEVGVVLYADGSAMVSDNSRGMPVDEHPEKHVSGVELIFTQLHAGGKFDHQNYAYSGGLHGVGASVVNALSRRLEVETCVDWTLWRMAFASEEVNGKIESGRPAEPLTRIGNTRRKGTRIRFWPDDRVFEDIAFNRDTVARRLRELSFLVRGVTFSLYDERSGDREEYRAQGGLSDYVAYLNTEKNALHKEIITIEAAHEDTKVRAALQWADGYTESIFSFVNNVPTAEGGTHEIGFKAALTRALNDYARRTGILKEKDKPLTGDDFREGLTAVLAVSVRDPQFEGQTKGRLGNPAVRPAVESVVFDAFTDYLADLRNGETGGAILGKAAAAAKVREAARKAKEVARQRNSLEAAPLVGKLAACTGRKPEANELLIVEGDSAGGSAKQGRDRRFQAVLPLRGKPLNAEKKRIDQVLQNEEFRTIITALGTGIAEDFTLGDLRYHKIIILADADQDGAHIRAILLTFFFRYMKELVAEGHVYIGMPPLYKVSKGNRVLYAYSDRELQKAIREIGKGYSLQRYKGLGEMNPEQLWETTMNPANRSLMRVTLEDAAEAEHLVTVLMGEKVEARRGYITRHANFNRADAFEGRVDA